MAFRLAYLHLILVHFNGQVQGHTHFNSEYLANGDRYSLQTLRLSQILCRMSAFDKHI